MNVAISAISDWLKSDLLMRRLAGNAGALLGGHTLSAVLNLVSLAIAARALGPSSFGALAIIVAYVRIVDQICNCQSWHAVIKYGAACQNENDSDGLRSLVKFGLIVDSATALVGAIVAMSMAALIGRAFGWGDELVGFASLYAIIIAFNIGGVPTALLRLYDRFRWLAIQSTASSVIRVVLAVIVAYTERGLAGFLIIWFVSQLFGYVLLAAMGVAVAHANDLRRVLAAKVTGIGSRFPGLWRYVWTTNLQSSVRLGTTELDILIVGTVLGQAGAGVYTVVKRFARVLGLLSTPLAQAIYPELARLWSAGRVDAMRSLIVRSTVLISVLALIVFAVFLIASDWILALTVGPGFSDAALPLVIYIGAMVLGTASFTIFPSLLAVGRPQASFVILGVSTAIYLPLLWQMTGTFGLPGAAVSYVVFYCIWIPLGVLALRRAWLTPVST